MLYGIMGAMHEEVALLRHEMETDEVVTSAGREYCRGRLYGADVVLVLSHWGKVASASTATTLIGEFGVDAIIFTGVAGAAAGDLEIGDIVVASELVQHDLDARPIFAQHEIPFLGISRLPVRPDWRKAALRACRLYLESTLRGHVGREVLETFHIVDPKVRSGLIASGDQFIADPGVLDRIRRELPGLQAVEMEGGAVAQVCHEWEIPYLVIRAISDKADKDSEIDFPRFLDEVASHYSGGILKLLMPMLRDL